MIELRDKCEERIVSDVVWNFNKEHCASDCTTCNYFIKNPQAAAINTNDDLAREIRKTIYKFRRRIKLYTKEMK